MLSQTQQLNLLDLYDEEIANAFDTHYDKLGNITKLMSTDQWEELPTRAGASDEKSHFGTTLWKQLRSSPMKNVLYEEVCAFLKKVNPDLHELLALHSDGAIYMHNLKKILTISPTLLDLLDAHLFLDFASSIKGFKKLATQLRLRLRTRDISDVSAKKHVLRHFPLLCAYSTEHILFGICKCSREGAEWVTSRYPNFMAEYDLACEDERMPRGLYFIVEPHEDIGTALDDADKLGVDAPNAFDVRFSRIPQAHLRSCVLGLSREVPLTLRDYQWELVKDACEGKNSVICAPTGSGKTVVAAYIIRQHILSRTMAQKNFKVCFIVPTGALAEQQKQLLDKYLNHCAKVRSLSGGDPTGTNPIVGTIRDADVVVITPQLIVNLLEPNLLAAEEQVRQDFSLSMFSMLLFDEAHHATESHPYNVILRDHYHVMKETGIGGKHAPQVVGLTASLGVGGSSTKDLDNALKHTVGLCANLDASAISRVRKNVQQMKDFTANSGDDFRSYQCSELVKSEPYRVLNSFVKKLESEIDCCDAVKISQELRDELCTYRPSHLLVAYEGWTGKASMTVKGNAGVSKETRELLMHHIEQLRVLYSAIDHLKLFNWTAASEYLQKAETVNTTCRREVASKLDAERRRLDASNSSNKSEMFLDLVRILEEQFKREPKSRVIVFLRTREYCLKLSRELSREPHFAAAYLTGANASTERGGQTASAQNTAIENFKNGKTPILCVTSVGEEGLDIPDCNMVINYNYSTNEIGHVQRRGRGRALDAKSILMATDQNVVKAHEQNIIREQLMEEALDYVDAQAPQWLQLKVKTAIKLMREERILAEALKQESFERQKNSSYTYLLLCASCDGFVAKADDIRTFQGIHHIVVDKEYWSRVSVKELSDWDVAIVKDMTIPQLGTHRCACVRTDGSVCGNELGRIMLFRNVLVPIVKCESVVFIEVPKGYTGLTAPENAKRHPCKKWKKVKEKCFTPRPVETIDLKMMDLASRKPKFSNRLLSNFENPATVESLEQFRENVTGY